MSGWTGWRKLADKRHWYPDCFDWEGPACYELAIAGPRGGDLKPVYVGETVNEKARMCAYARNGSHLSAIIDQHLKQGWCLFYRSQTAESKKAAVIMQNDLLKQYDYDWNILLNIS